jgi:WD40 repeat protein
LAVVTADLLQGVVLLGLLQRGLAGNDRWHNDYKIVGGAALIMGVAVIAFLLLPSPINRTSSAAFASVGCEASVMGSSGDNGLGIGRLVSVKTGGHKDMIDTLTMLPDGSGLLTASRDGTVRLWQWPCLQEKLVLPTASNFNDSAPVSVTGDGRYLVTKNPRSEIIIVELATGETVQVAARMIGDVTAVSPDGQYIAASNKDIIHVYNFADGREICQFTAHEEASPITNILFTPDSQRVLSVAYYDGVHVWQPTTCTEELVLERPYYAIDQIVVHPNGQFVAASTSQESQVYVWNLTTGQTMFERQRISDDNWMGNILFAPDGRTLIAGGDYGTLRIWDWQTGVEIYHNTIPDLSRVAITPDGQQLITMTHNGAVTTLNWEEMIE